VYGYSKTFGKTPGCNEKTADIIRANCPGLARVDWSDQGY
jgi:phosphohistidine phosphatase